MYHISSDTCLLMTNGQTHLWSHISAQMGLIGVFIVTQTFSVSTSSYKALSSGWARSAYYIRWVLCVFCPKRRSPIFSTIMTMENSSEAIKRVETNLECEATLRFQTRLISWKSSTTRWSNLQVMSNSESEFVDKSRSGTFSPRVQSCVSTLTSMSRVSIHVYTRTPPTHKPQHTNTCWMRFCGHSKGSWLLEGVPFSVFYAYVTKMVDPVVPYGIKLRIPVYSLIVRADNYSSERHADP